MLRGNHECRQMTTNSNFKKECEVKYDSEIYNLFMETLDCLPLACTINDKFFTLQWNFTYLRKIEDINAIKRYQESPKNGLMCDILWSDPIDKDEEAKNFFYIFQIQQGIVQIFLE